MFSTSLSLAVVPCLPAAPWAQTWGSWAVHWERCGTAGGSNHTTHPFSSTQSTLGWMSGKKCSQKSGQAVEQAAQGDGGVTWKCSRNTEIGFLRYLRTWYSMHGGDGLRAGLDDLRSIFQPLWFYDLGMGCPQVGCEFFFSHQGHTWRSSRPQALMKRHISVALVSPRWTCSCPPTPRHWEVLESRLELISNSRKWLIIGEKCGKKHILCDFSSLPPYCQGLSVGCVARLLLVGLSALKSVPFSGLSCFMVDETEPFVSFAFLILAKWEIVNNHCHFRCSTGFMILWAFILSLLSCLFSLLSTNTVGFSSLRKHFRPLVFFACLFGASFAASITRWLTWILLAVLEISVLSPTWDFTCPLSCPLFSSTSQL